MRVPECPKEYHQISNWNMFDRPAGWLAEYSVVTLQSLFITTHDILTRPSSWPTLGTSLLLTDLLSDFGTYEPT